MIKVNDVLKYLSSLYPADTACDFDNVGLLIGDGNCETDKVLVCLDCDINAVNKANEIGCKLIITHHPVIFDGIKNVPCDSVIYKLIKSGISVISMHTNLDVGKGGVNDQLCKILELKKVKKYKANDGYILNEGVTDISNADELAKDIKRRLDGTVKYVVGSKPIKKVLVCSGSGGNYLTDAINGKFDALITADVKHNVFIDALNYDITLFDAGHYNTENIVIEPLCGLLSKKFKDVSFIPFLPDKIKNI